MATKKLTKKPKKTPVIEAGVSDSLYFSENIYPNWGKFVPLAVNYGMALEDGDKRVNESDRREQVRQSMGFVANLPEVKSAFDRFIDFTIGTALVPSFNGDQDWARVFKRNFLNQALNNLTILGTAVDWQELWRLIVFIVFAQGDCLIIPYKDRYGLPKLDVIEGSRIRNRNGGKTVNVPGKFEGWDCEDGRILNSKGEEKGYVIEGRTAEEDYTIGKEFCYLIFRPWTLSKGRGIPILSPGARHARNLIDFNHYVPQIVKAEGQVQLVETNQEGKARPGGTSYGTKKVTATASTTASARNTACVDAVQEYRQAGIYYVKSKGGKLESLKSNRPASEVQTYITTMQKELLTLVFPHHLLLSPETIGGPGARGIKETLVAALNPWRALVERYALIVLEHVISCAITNPAILATYNITSNFADDPANPENWTVSKAPDPVFDIGQERNADLNDRKACLVSDPQLMAKENRLEDDVLREIAKSYQKKADLIKAFQENNKELAQYAPQMFGLQPLPPSPTQTQ